MSVAAKADFGKTIIDFISKRVVYHSLFWIVLLLVLSALDTTHQSFGFSLGNELINIIFYAILVYFNLLYLIPNYLTKKKFLTYMGLLLVAVLIITPLKVIVLYFRFSGQPEVQANLVSHQDLYFLSNFFIVGTSTIFSIVTDWARQLREKSDLERQTMQSELRFLKSQINPHFLFNTLNNLYALTLKKSDQAPEIVIKLSEMMRYMLYECNEKQVLLVKEINYIRNYLDLEKLRQGQSVDISLEVNGMVSNQKIAPLMFITFLENSFKHGLNNQLQNGFVHVKIDIESHQVHFFVENSKPNRLPNQEHKRPGGIGLVNVRRRLDLLYPGQYDLIIDDNPNSYAVNLTLEV
jgi:two-component system LytT family sensor kinase